MLNSFNLELLVPSYLGNQGRGIVLALVMII